MARGDTTGPTVQIRRRVRATAEQIFDLWTRRYWEERLDAMERLLRELKKDHKDRKHGSR